MAIPVAATHPVNRVPMTMSPPIRRVDPETIGFLVNFDTVAQPATKSKSFQKTLCSMRRLAARVILRLGRGSPSQVVRTRVPFTGTWFAISKKIRKLPLMGKSFIATVSS